jgi:TonB-like protein
MLTGIDCAARRTPPKPFQGEGDRAPEQVHCPRPWRPPDADHPTGTDTVVVEVVLDTTGHPILSTMKVVRSTDPHLNPAATLAAWGCRYTPARKGGHSMQVIIHQPFMF